MVVTCIAITFYSDRLMVLGDQPSLPEHHRAIVWQWFLENFESYLSGKSEQQQQQQLQQDQNVSEEALNRSTGSDHGLTADMQLKQKALSPSIFDSDGKKECRASIFMVFILLRAIDVSVVHSQSYAVRCMLIFFENFDFSLTYSAGKEERLWSV